MDLILITWLDHSSNAGWYSKEQIAEMQPTTCQTVGWVVSENENSLLIAGSFNSDGEYGEVTLIMKPAITERIGLNRTG